MAYFIRVDAANEVAYELITEPIQEHTSVQEPIHTLSVLGVV